MAKNLFEEFKKSGEFQPFERYRVRLRLDDIVGGCPTDPKLIEGWLKAANKEWTAEQREAIKNATLSEIPEAVGELADRQAISFKRGEKGLYIEGRQVKAMLKENANIIKDIVPGFGKSGEEQKGITNLKSKVAEQLFVEEDNIYLGREAPDSIEERPIHVMTPTGPRSALKRVEIAKNVEIEFTLARRKGNVVPEKAMLAILTYGQTLGLGADRSQSRGRFEVLSVEKLDA